MANNFYPGLFGGASIQGGSIFLPGNQVLRDYMITNSTSLFKFKCTAFRAPEMKITSSKDAGINVESELEPEPLAEFEFVYNQENFSLSHSHNWNSPGGIIGKFAELFKEGVGGFSGDTIMKILAGGKELIETGQTPIRTEWNSFGSLDLAKSYQGTTSPDINISFVLFTSDDPLKDVVFPATFLTYMSYPRLLGKKTEIEQMLGQIARSLGDESATNENASIQQSGSNLISDTLNSTVKKIANVAKDKWRYRLGFAPPIWTVSSSNGLIHLNNAALTNVTINYHGPWIGTKVIGAETIDPSIFNNQNPSNDPTGKSQQIGGFPSWADVTLTFKNNFEQVFGEEWMMAMIAGANHYSKVFSEVRREFQNRTDEEQDKKSNLEDKDLPGN